MARGVGTVITDTLAAWGIKKNSGCPCNDIATEMDQIGADAVESRLQEFTNRMYDSIKLWRREHRYAIVQPPKFTIEILIKYGIQKAREK